MNSYEKEMEISTDKFLKEFIEEIKSEDAKEAARISLIEFAMSIQPSLEGIVKQVYQIGYQDCYSKAMCNDKWVYFDTFTNDEGQAVADLPEEFKNPKQAYLFRFPSHPISSPEITNYHYEVGYFINDSYSFEVDFDIENADASMIFNTPIRK